MRINTVNNNNQQQNFKGAWMRCSDGYSGWYDLVQKQTTRLSNKDLRRICHANGYTIGLNITQKTGEQIQFVQYRKTGHKVHSWKMILNGDEGHKFDNLEGQSKIEFIKELIIKGGNALGLDLNKTFEVLDRNPFRKIF